MKIAKTFLLNILVVLSFVSCSLEDPIESSITKYAIIDYEELVVISLNGIFTPEAVATIGQDTVQVTVEGNPLVGTVGVYDVFYSATNADGFEAKVQQKVVVHDPSIVGADVSGEIRDKNNNSRTGTIELVEGTNSIFRASDFGFAGTFPVYFQMNGNEIIEIPQPYDLGATDVDLTYDPVQKTFTVLIHPSGFNYTFEYIN